MQPVTKIIISGFGCSGSSVVVDWAREYSSCHVMEGEFDLFRHPDGVQDLRDALTKRVSLRRCYLAMERFSRLIVVMARAPDGVFGRGYEQKTYVGFEAHMHALLKALTAVSYPAGYTATWIEKHAEVSQLGPFADENSVPPRIRKLLSNLHRRAETNSNPKAAIAKFMLRLMFQPRQVERDRMYQPISLAGPEFDTIARPFFDEMADRIGPKDKTHLVLDQGLSPSGIVDGLELMSDCRAVLIHRDPRDVFMSGLTKDRTWVPTQSAEDFASWFKITMPKLQVKDPRICVLGFEDLMTSPDQYFGYLESFLGMNPVGKKTGCFFDPEISRKNVGKWRNHPDQTLISDVAGLCRPHYEAMLKNNTQITNA